MSGIQRFLSRKDKHQHHSPLAKTNQEAKDANDTQSKLKAVFVEKGGSQKSHDKKVAALQERLSQVGITSIPDSDALWILNATYANGDVDRAFERLIALEEAMQGIIKPYNPNMRLLGAVNREAVTCYIDATLFAMFARLDSFEPMLYNTFLDDDRRRLAILLRLWVNAVRTGRLITTDITRQIQNALAACGWKDAALLQQQDASEAFSFVTEKLELPMLTLKMDIFHIGREDAKDDHRLVRERLLEVAIPEEPSDGHSITLEECLENYLNSKIEVKRYMDRKGTMSSLKSRRSFDEKKAWSVHVETVEVKDSAPSTPVSLFPHTPLSPTPSNEPPPYSAHLRPSVADHRTPSIIQEVQDLDEKRPTREEPVLQRAATMSRVQGRSRAGSVRKEVMMPAWQFFRLIPWYTDCAPDSNQEVARHFAEARPVLGICLKRYAMTDGEFTRRDTHVDIPIEIALPHFIEEDDSNRQGSDGGFSNFKLSLQSVVCHRGNSVYSGHYISLVRGQQPDPVSPSSPNQETGNGWTEDKRWMLFDDLASSRIRYVNIEEALRTESPYLLFYQVQPIDSDSNMSGSNGHTVTAPLSNVSDTKSNGPASLASVVDSLSSMDMVEVPRPSMDRTTSDQSKLLADDIQRRSSVTFTNDSYVDLGKPSTGSSSNAPSSSQVNPPNSKEVNHAPAAPVSRSADPSRRPSKNLGHDLSQRRSKSRPVSMAGDNMLSASWTKLAQKISNAAKDGKDPAEVHSRKSSDQLRNSVSHVPESGAGQADEALLAPLATNRSDARNELAVSSTAPPRIDAVAAASQPTAQEGKGKKEKDERRKRDKRHSAVLGGSAKKKDKEREANVDGGKPDRECVVM